MKWCQQIKKNRKTATGCDGRRQSCPVFSSINKYMIRKIWSFPLDKPLLLSNNKVLTSLIWLDKLNGRKTGINIKGEHRGSLFISSSRIKSSLCIDGDFLWSDTLKVRSGIKKEKKKKGVLLDIQVFYTSVNKPICRTVRDYCGWKYRFFAVGVRERWSRPWRCPFCVPIHQVSHNKIITSSRMLPGWRAVKGRGGKWRGVGRGADISTVRHLGSTGLYSVPAPRWSWSECKCRRRCRPGPRLEHRETFLC